MHCTKILPSLNFGVIAPWVCTPKNVALGYDIGKISAGCLFQFRCCRLCGWSPRTEAVSVLLWHILWSRLIKQDVLDAAADDTSLTDAVMWVAWSTLKLWRQTDTCRLGPGSSVTNSDNDDDDDLVLASADSVVKAVTVNDVYPVTQMYTPCYFGELKPYNSKYCSNFVLFWPAVDICAL